MDWRATTVAPDGTHHLLGDEPLYAPRFLEVLKFHTPGLAPALTTDGAMHIGVDGRPAYEARFVRTFGFYEGLAAVDSGAGWFHITPEGRRAYGGEWAWCGNYQGGRCPVRRGDGRYLHVGVDGREIGGRTWRYAGDFRDGVGVVQRDDGLHTHIDDNASVVHGRWFHDLDVFHKGFARARDLTGWMHVDAQGAPLYERRFANVEPFYNSQARVERFDGGLEVINERGQALVVLRPSTPRSGSRETATRVLLIGLPGAGKSTVGGILAQRLGVDVFRLDDIRAVVSDGTIAGDYLARSVFLRRCARGGAALYEFCAAGYHRVAVRQAFREAADPLLTVWIDTPAPVRRGRLAHRSTTVPLPDWGIAPGSFDAAMEAKLAHDFDSGWWAESPGWRATRVDGTRPPEEVASAIAATLIDAGGAR